MKTPSFRFVAAPTLGLAVLLSVPGPVESQKLPIYELATPKLDREMAGRLFEELAGKKEGRRVVELAASGWNVIDAWFRAAWEIQPSTNGSAAPNGPTIFVTAMYAHMGAHETRDDHIWRAPGPTVADPVGSGQRRTLMWSGT